MVIYLRITYGLELLSALNLGFALFMPWHTRTGSAGAMIGSVFEKLNANATWTELLIPWCVLFLLFPMLFASIIRGAMGIIEHRKVMWLTWTRRSTYGAFGVMAWFYFSMEPEGRILFGFWLASLAVGILLCLLLIETSMPDLTRAQQRGNYQPCPHCGNPNIWSARKCVYCGRLLFPLQRG